MIPSRKEGKTMKIMKGLFKKNQVIIYVIALMLVTAGYLNYTTNTAEQVSAQTAMEMEANDDMQIADIGDATLVNSEAVNENEVTENTTVNENGNTSNTNEITTEETNKDIAQNTNTSENNTITQTSSTVTTDEYFTKSKLERDTMYSQMIETYQNIIDSSTASDEQRTIATQEITNINNTKNKIMICENLLQTKGFDKNIIFVNGQSVSVVIELEGDTIQEQIAQIQNIVSREVGVEVQNINITQK